MACVASPLAPDSPSCLHDDVAKLYGEAQKLYADAQQDFNGSKTDDKVLFSLYVCVEKRR